MTDTAQMTPEELRMPLMEAMTDHVAFDGWTDAQWQKVARAVKAVNDRWMSHLSGSVDAGQIAIGCALGYLDFRHDARNWRDGNKELAAWYERFAQRDSMQASQPRG